MRFTIRDLLYLMVVVGVAFSGTANYPAIKALTKAACDRVWLQVQDFVPLSGRASVPPEWQP
jgi:hypothetical protein